MSVLYREYRPKKFSDILGQEHITSVIKNQIKSKKINHAYLLCGTRGTGKTTTAKILAKAINCLNPIDGEPCNECEICRKIDKGICTDVTELDAASNNGVDNIRNIIGETKYAATETKYKVYIIDEVHMLSNGAFNSFLKTLEEPPKNVVFILATTDPQKLPVTILSRCQRYDFRRIKNEDIFLNLSNISKKENINIDSKCLQLISKVADGAMRDALSILDQAQSLGSEIKYTDLLNMVGISSNESIFNLITSIIAKDKLNALSLIDLVDKKGVDFILFVRDTIKMLRNILLTLSIGAAANEIISLSDEDIQKLSDVSKMVSEEIVSKYINILQDTEQQMKWTSQGRIAVELTVIKLCNLNTTIKNDSVLLEEIKSSISYILNDQKTIYNLMTKLTANTNIKEPNHSSNNTKGPDSQNDTNTKVLSVEEAFDSIIKCLSAVEDDKIKSVIPGLKKISERKIYSYDLSNHTLLFSGCSNDEIMFLKKLQKILTNGFSKYLGANISILIQ